MKKYFFFDIDRTLAVGITKQVPEDTKACLKKLRAAGHFVSIASGRLQSDVAAFAHTLDITSFVADGGNSLTIDNKLLDMTGLPKENCLLLIKELERCCLPWAVIYENANRLHTPYAGFTEPERATYFEVKLGPVDFTAVKQIYKMLVYRPVLNGPQPNWQSLPLIPYFGNTYLIEPVDKGAGIRRCMETLRAPLKDVVVFGDGFNDLQMFSPDWFSIAMGNAREPLKEKADYITDDCDKGGILKACQKFGWL